MRTDEKTDMTKLIVAFRSFANAPKKRAKAPSYRELFQCIRGTWVADGVSYIRPPRSRQGFYPGIEEIDDTCL